MERVYWQIGVQSGVKRGRSYCSLSEAWKADAQYILKPLFQVHRDFS